MKKIIGSLLAVLFLVGCQAPQYDLIDFPSAEKDFLSDYKVKILDASFIDSISLRPETPEQELVISYAPNGKQYLNVVIELTRFITINQSENHVLDEDDFKIKDHLGVSFPHSYFSTVNSLTDYTWKGVGIEPGGDSVTIDLYFELKTDISFSKYLIILEVDFFNAIGDGIDIPLTHKTN